MMWFLTVEFVACDVDRAHLVVGHFDVQVGVDRAADLEASA
jgi:hypothetical protein